MEHKECVPKESVIRLAKRIEQRFHGMKCTMYGFDSIDPLEFGIEKLSSKSNSITDTDVIISIIMNGQLFNAKENFISARKYLVDSHKIHSIIEMPSKLLSGTMISFSIMILKNNCDAIRFIDASSESVSSRRDADLSDENIDNIINMLDNDSDFIRIVSHDIIKKNDYSLSPNIYFVQVFSNGKTLKEISDRIITGKTYHDGDIECRVIKPSNVTSGLFTIDLDSLDDEYIEISDKDLIPSGEVITFSKNRALTLNIPSGIKVVAGAGVFVIIPKDDVCTRYIEAFINSRVCMEQLSILSRSSVISRVNPDIISIPIPDINEQNKIASEYCNIIAAANEALTEYNDCISKMHELF